MDTKRTPSASVNGRFTTGTDALYAVSMEYPAMGWWVVRRLAAGSRNVPREIRQVELLGNGAFRWSRPDESLIEEALAQKLCAHALMLKISKRCSLPLTSSGRAISCGCLLCSATHVLPAAPDLLHREDDARHFLDAEALTSAR